MSWRSNLPAGHPQKVEPLPPAPRIPAPGGKVRPGQVWASLDSRDRRNNWRQERIVLSVSDNRREVNGQVVAQGWPLASLYTLPGKPHQSASNCAIDGGAILRHSYVRDATPAERARFGL